MTQRGFTLIEVLVASAIFAGMMVIGVSSFSNVNHVNERIEITRNLSQTGNFVMEALARDIRSAPYNFTSENGVPIVSNGLISSNRLNTFRNGTCGGQSYSINQYQLVVDTQNSSYSDLMLLRNHNCLNNSLLPDGIRVLNQSQRFLFEGTADGPFTSAGGAIQPYVTISFTLVDTESGTTQSFRTTVTSILLAR